MRKLQMERVKERQVKLSEMESAIFREQKNNLLKKKEIQKAIEKVI